MLLEEFFDFFAPDDIRLKGHRIGIETILYEYLYHAQTPEEIAKTYTSLSLKEVYATILYYLCNQEIISQYIADWLEWSHQQHQQSILTPHPSAVRLKKIKEERQKSLQLCL